MSFRSNVYGHCPAMIETGRYPRKIAKKANPKSGVFLCFKNSAGKRSEIESPETVSRQHWKLIVCWSKFAPECLSQSR
jgi:hypothetical protein